MTPHLCKILFKDLLIEGCLAHIYGLYWLAILTIMLAKDDMNHDKDRTHLRMTRRGDLDTPSIKYFLAKNNDGSMPRGDASNHRGGPNETRVPYSVNLPSNNLH